MNETDDELRLEIKQHADKAVESFREGQEIHQEYVRAPGEHSLADEVERFTGKLKEGIAEVNKTAKLQKDYLNGKSQLKPK